MPSFQPVVPVLAHVHELARAFNDENKLSGANWDAWQREFAFVFAELDLHKMSWELRF